MSTLLIIEDEAPILIGLEDALSQAGYQVLTARTGEQGLRLAQQEAVDLVLLDLMLPQMSGLEVLQRLRQHDPRLPVVILTAKGQEKDKLAGFQSGADDYITKPFSLKELLARVHAVCKRTRGQSVPLPACTLNGIRFDFQAMKATRDGRPVDFSARELELLRYLIQHRNQVVSRNDILERIWHYDADTTPTTRTVDNYILSLRRKLEKQAHARQHIFTVHGKGYRFEA